MVSSGVPEGVAVRAAVKANQKMVNEEEKWDGWHPEGSEQGKNYKPDSKTCGHTKNENPAVLTGKILHHSLKILD